MSAQSDKLTAEVAAQTTVINSAIALINGFQTQLAAGIAAAKAGDTTVLDKIASDLQANTDALAGAVAANTPAAIDTPPAQQTAVADAVAAIPPAVTAAAAAVGTVTNPDGTAVDAPAPPVVIGG